MSNTGRSKRDRLRRAYFGCGRWSATIFSQVENIGVNMNPQYQIRYESFRHF